MESKHNYGKLANRFAMDAAREAAKIMKVLQRIKIKRKQLSQEKNSLVLGGFILALPIFLCSIIAEVATSYDIYYDIAAKNLLFIAPKYIAIAIACLFIFLAAWAGDLMSLFVLEGTRIKTVNELVEQGWPEELASEKVRNKARHRFIFGVLLGIMVLVIIGLLSSHRIETLEIINPGKEYHFFDRYLPVFAYAAEIITGIFLRSIFLRYKLMIQLFLLKRKVNKLKKNYHSLASKAIACYEKTDLEFIPSKDLTDILYRYENSSINDPGYYNPVSTESAHSSLVAKESSS